MYVEFKGRKTGCGTHCTELIWRSEGPQEYVSEQPTLTKKCCYLSEEKCWNASWK